MIQIGSLEVDIEGRQLLRDGARLAVGSRAFDVLAVLVEARGELVSKDDLLKQVWPTTVVEENNLHVHLSRLRCLLAESRSLLQTVSGRGYRLAIGSGLKNARTSFVIAPIPSDGPTQSDTPNNLPATASGIIGRDEAIQGILDALKLNRHLTLAGAGGIGKTRLAIEVAHRALPLFPDGVYLISLASATDDESVLHAASSALGIDPEDGPLSVARIGEEIAGLRMLFVLDNCEQVSDASAKLAEALAVISSEARVIVTSRGPIRCANERIYRVEPLPVPPQTVFNDDVARCSAVQLFLSHARGLDPLFPSDERSVELIHMICRRLDGIPLAIELAAARASILGVETLAARLDDRFRILTGGSRSALPQHQTLRATFDWSYALLDEAERTTLRRLSIFPAGFTMPAAVAVASDASLDEYAIAAAVARLVEKSLIVRPAGTRAAAYRMLQTTRSYAQERLDDNGERRQMKAHHARYFSELLGAISNANSSTTALRADGAWQHDMRALLDDLRGALTWALSSQGDRAIAETLAVRFVWLLFELSLVDECCSYARRSLEAFEKQPGESAHSLKRVRMHLQAAHAAALIYVQGPSQTTSIWSEVLTSAIAFSDRSLEARALWGLWNACQIAGDAYGARSFAQRFAALEAQVFAVEAAGASAGMLGCRLTGISAHFVGDQHGAYSALQRFLAGAPSARSWVPLGRSIDQRIVTAATFARVLWLRGERDHALRTADRCLAEARAQEQAIVTCYVLIEASIPVALLSGDMQAAAEAIDLLNDTSTRAGLNIARACRRAYQSCLLSLGGASPECLTEFSAAIADLDALGFGVQSPMLVGQYALMQGRSGKRDESISTIAEALRRSDETGNRWFASELHRIRGELLISEASDPEDLPPVSAVTDAEGCFLEAINVSRTQGAVSLELRANLSLARLRYLQGRHADALACLGQTWRVFPDGCNWPEFTEATRLAKGVKDAIKLKHRGDSFAVAALHELPIDI